MIKNFISISLSFLCLIHIGMANGHDKEKFPLLPKSETVRKTNPELWEKLRKTNPEAIGSIAESSQDLAVGITRYIPKLEYSSRRILEVGAGSGVFTRELIKKLGPHDHLDVVELTRELCDLLEDEFKDNPLVTIYCGDILQWQPGDNTYDYIVSGLPFNSFPAELVRNITEQYVRLTKPNGHISFFEYLFLPTLRPIFMEKKSEQEYIVTRNVIRDFVRKYKTDSMNVYKNLPPAKVYFLQIKK